MSFNCKNKKIFKSLAFCLCTTSMAFVPLLTSCGDQIVYSNTDYQILIDDYGSDIIDIIVPENSNTLCWETKNESLLLQYIGGQHFNYDFFESRTNYVPYSEYGIYFNDGSYDEHFLINSTFDQDAGVIWVNFKLNVDFNKKYVASGNLFSIKWYAYYDLSKFDENLEPLFQFTFRILY